MRYTSDSETSTPLPDPGRPGETADRNSQTIRCVGRYTTSFDGPAGAYLYELQPEDDDGLG